MDKLDFSKELGNALHTVIKQAKECATKYSISEKAILTAFAEAAIIIAGVYLALNDEELKNEISRADN